MEQVELDLDFIKLFIQIVIGFLEVVLKFVESVQIVLRLQLFQCLVRYILVARYFRGILNVFSDKIQLGRIVLLFVADFVDEFLFD